jgi:hypothetical protein
MTKGTYIPDTAIEVVTDLAWVAAPGEMKAQCYQEVCYLAEQFIDIESNFKQANM